jgi:hypothetical protein
MSPSCCPCSTRSRTSRAAGPATGRGSCSPTAATTTTSTAVCCGSAGSNRSSPDAACHGSGLGTMRWVGVGSLRRPVTHLAVPMACRGVMAQSASRADVAPSPCSSRPEAGTATHRLGFLTRPVQTGNRSLERGTSGSELARCRTPSALGAMPVLAGIRPGTESVAERVVSSRATPGQHVAAPADHPSSRCEDLVERPEVVARGADGSARSLARRTFSPSSSSVSAGHTSASNGRGGPLRP